MDKSRTVAQDAAKGLMIIMVVFFHCYLLAFATPAEAMSNYTVLNAFFPYILASFFFYTGYNYLPSGRSFKESIARRAKQLLIPLVLSFIISTVLISSIELIHNHNDIGATFHMIGNTILYSLMSEPLSLMVGFPKSGGLLIPLVIALGLLWFLYCLFVCSIFFFLLVKHTNKKLTTLVSVVVILLAMSFCLGQFVGIYLPYTVQCYPLVLAIMLTAAYLRKSHFLNIYITKKRHVVFHTINAIIAEGIVVGLCLFAHYQTGALYTGALTGGRFDVYLKGIDVFTSYLFAIIGTYAIHTFCRLIKLIPYVGISLQWIGNHSAFFYLFHPIFLEIIASLIFQNKIILGVGQAYVYTAFVVACLVICCLIIDFVIKKKHIATPMKDEIDNAKDPEGVIIDEIPD